MNSEEELEEEELEQAVQYVYVACGYHDNKSPHLLQGVTSNLQNTNVGCR